jgi:hypothetical protein
MLVIVGLVGLVSLRVAYDLTYEPALWVRVRWRDGTGDWRRAWLERTYRLGDPVNPEGLGYSYILYDTSRRNIEAMVTDPEVADTHDIDRDKFEVPWETQQYSERWMWVADRVPVLRQPEVRWLAEALLAMMTLLGFGRILRTVHWRRRWRAIVE